MTRNPASLPYAVHGHYYVEGSGWFVVRCKTKRIARSWGVKEFGRGQVREVRQATNHDLATYKQWRSFGSHLVDALPQEDYPE